MGKRMLLVTAAVISVILILPTAIGLGLVNISSLSILGSVANPSGSPPLGNPSTMILFDPAMNVTDYEDPDHNVTIGSTVSFSVNISDVTDLYTWHVKLSWNKDILNASLISYGDFLSLGTASPNGTSSDVANITSIFHDDGYGWIAESVLGDYAGVNDNGTLLEIEFDIVGYGYSYININITGSMPTELLNSTSNSMTFTASDGFFKNAIPGDMTDDTPETPPSPPDGDVDRYDLGEFADAYGSSEGDPNYNILADISDDTGTPTAPDGDVDRYDLGVFADNYGRSLS